MMDKRNAIKIIKEKIKAASNLVILSGAGISAESGIPTFRGEDGLWKKYRAEELASPKAFSSNPELVWEWYNWRRELIRSKKPNQAHISCVDLEKKFKDKFTIITQNVDGLHQQAGNNNVIELHGNIWKTRCTNCGDIKENKSTLGNLPKCSICNGLLRPHIVWFGEALDEELLYKAYKVLLSTDIVIVVGTSGIVYPAAQFAGTAKDSGAFVIEIDIKETPQSSLVDVSVRGKAGEILPLIVESNNK